VLLNILKDGRNYICGCHQTGPLAVNGMRLSAPLDPIFPRDALLPNYLALDLNPDQYICFLRCATRCIIKMAWRLTHATGLFLKAS
jgi:hypothetical protein